MPDGIQIQGLVAARPDQTVAQHASRAPWTSLAPDQAERTSPLHRAYDPEMFRLPKFSSSTVICAFDRLDARTHRHQDVLPSPLAQVGSLTGAGHLPQRQRRPWP